MVRAIIPKVNWRGEPTNNPPPDSCGQNLPLWNGTEFSLHCGEGIRVMSAVTMFTAGLNSEAKSFEGV